MTDRFLVSQIRKKLRHAWSPFFSRFGRLTSVQTLTIPKILEGRNVVIASPTASGKTEAVLAPIAERFISEKWNALGVLYIVPTRALANDILVRIDGPLSDMGITTLLKHGDMPYLPKILPDVLITTPESFDSLLCRRSHIFCELRTVVLDEIHLVDNTARGDQLRILMHRLQSISLTPLNIHLLSATLSEPAQVAQRYVNEFEVVTVEGDRKIEYSFLATPKELYTLVRAEKLNKLLCFCNLRESVETLASELSELWSPYPVVVHHGSLKRQIREETETVMQEAKIAVCVATSTLEIGIDIGDIDLIVIAETPWSLSSLLQRIGRGNRRSNKARVVSLVSSTDERLVMDAMFKAAISGNLQDQPYRPDLSVVVQQSFSYLFQHPEGVSESELIDILNPICIEGDSKRILTNLTQNEWIERNGGKLLASTRVMDMGEHGKIHSNIPDEQAFSVIDVDSGQQIGSISGVFDNVFVLAQRSWHIVSVLDNIVRVRSFKGRGAAPTFHRHRGQGAFASFLPTGLSINTRS